MIFGVTHNFFRSDCACFEWVILLGRNSCFFPFLIKYISCKTIAVMVIAMDLIRFSSAIRFHSAFMFYSLKYNYSVVIRVNSMEVNYACFSKMLDKRFWIWGCRVGQ